MIEPVFEVLPREPSQIKHVTDDIGSADNEQQ
jgi:hypothetical protein